MIGRRKNLGFTLVEILVAVSIIGIVSAVALTMFSTPQKQARDTERRNDLRQFQLALENWANQNNGFYPSFTTAAGEPASTLCGYLDPASGPTYLADCSNVVDPRQSMGHDPYRYQTDGTGSGTPTGTKYVLWAKLEAQTDTYWVVCSNGRSGKKTAQSFQIVNADCPTDLE